MRFFPTGPRDRAEHGRQRLREAEEYRRRARAQDDEDEEIDEDEFCAEDPADELIDTLRKIERHRAELQAAASYFEAILDGKPELRRQWEAFLRAGGIGSGDLRRFLDGHVIRYRPTRRRKHLRLVSNQRKPIAIRRGDDAA